MNIEPKYATFEQAKLLNDIPEFNLECRTAYDEHGYVDNAIDWNGEEYFTKEDIANAKENLGTSYLRPEHWQLVDWYWETYRIDISVIPIRFKGEKTIGFQYRIINFSDPEVDEVVFEHQYNRGYTIYATKEAAYSAAFDELLKNKNTL